MAACSKVIVVKMERGFSSLISQRSFCHELFSFEFGYKISYVICIRRCSDSCAPGHLAELSIPYIPLLFGYFKGTITKPSLSGTTLHVLVSAVHVFTLINSLLGFINPHRIEVLSHLWIRLLCLQNPLKIFDTCAYMCSVTQSCLTHFKPMDCSLPGSSIRGIFQARIFEWVAISSSRGSSPPRESNPHLLCLLHCRRILCHWDIGETHSVT